MWSYGSSLRCLVLILGVAVMFFGAESKTFWRDIEVLKEVKNGIDISSVNPGSCVSSWDFTLDPCDNLFGEIFTCGFRCDVVVSGLNRVTELTLDQAGYKGSLSSSSWNLPYLETLDFSNNLFSGAIPESLSNLTRLRRLSLSRNSFSGEIPSLIGSLTVLEELYIDNNNLQGTIPACFNGLLSLQRLELQSNKLTGPLPDLSSLKNLNFFDASDNGITGEIPAAFPVSLIQLTMRNNSLSETMNPESFKNLAYLQVIDLSYNNLSGPVPSVLFELPSLEQLTLSFNHLSSIETPSAAMSEVIAIDLSNNELRGFLPSFMALMPKLSALSLEHNKFSGMIPVQYALKTVFPDTGIEPFERLLLSGNYLFGPIPGPLTTLQPGSANVNLVDNCLYRCPAVFFFCQGGEQKSMTECKSFGPMIP